MYPRMWLTCAVFNMTNELHETNEDLLFDQIDEKDDAINHTT